MCEAWLHQISPIGLKAGAAKYEAALSSKTLMHINQTAEHHIPENSNLDVQDNETLKSHYSILLLVFRNHYRQLAEAYLYCRKQKAVASFLLWFSVTKNFGPLSIVIFLWLYLFVPLNGILLIYFDGMRTIFHILFNSSFTSHLMPYSLWY